MIWGITWEYWSHDSYSHESWSVNNTVVQEFTHKGPCEHSQVIPQVQILFPQRGPLGSNDLKYQPEPNRLDKLKQHKMMHSGAKRPCMHQPVQCSKPFTKFKQKHHTWNLSKKNCANQTWVRKNFSHKMCKSQQNEIICDNIEHS